MAAEHRAPARGEAQPSTRISPRRQLATLEQSTCAMRCASRPGEFDRIGHEIVAPMRGDGPRVRKAFVRLCRDAAIG